MEFPTKVRAASIIGHIRLIMFGISGNDIPTAQYQIPEFTAKVRVGLTSGWSNLTCYGQC